MSVLIDIADAVATALTAATLPLEFTAVRTYVPDWSETDTGLKVFVIPGRTMTANASSRLVSQYEYAVQIAIYSKVSVTNGAFGAAELDGLMDFTEQVVDLFKAGTDMAGASLVGEVRNEPTYDPAQLHANHCYVSVINLTYRTMR